jgi:hypothetical protein
MTVNEIAEALGETTKAILDALHRGKLHGTKIPHPQIEGKEIWNVTTPFEEARIIMANRIRRHRRPKTVAPSELPVAKDIFTTEEAAKAAGISKETARRALHDLSSRPEFHPLQNGKQQYYPRAAILKLREQYAKRIMPPKAIVSAAKFDVPVKINPWAHQDLDEVNVKLDQLDKFLRAFAKSCGYVG